MSVQVVRAALANYLDGQASWRDSQVGEHREDSRGQASGVALRNLAHYVRALPDSDRRLAALDKIADYLIANDVVMPGDDAAQQVTGYGFHQPTDPDWRKESESEFLDRFVRVCQDETERLGLEQLDEAASSGGSRDALRQLDELDNR